MTDEKTPLLEQKWQKMPKIVVINVPVIDDD